MLDYSQCMSGVDLKDQLFLFDCEKANEQVVHETIPQISECFHSEYHDNKQE
jgi:hypothetical protein